MGITFLNTTSERKMRKYLQFIYQIGTREPPNMTGKLANVKKKILDRKYWESINPIYLHRLTHTRSYELSAQHDLFGRMNELLFGMK